MTGLSLPTRPPRTNKQQFIIIVYLAATDGNHSCQWHRDKVTLYCVASGDRCWEVHYSRLERETTKHQRPCVQILSQTPGYTSACSVGWHKVVSHITVDRSTAICFVRVRITKFKFVYCVTHVYIMLFVLSPIKIASGDLEQYLYPYKLFPWMLFYER